MRAAIGWAAETGFRRIHLDAAAPEIRPRVLDRSARRDLAATLRRESLGFTGLDLWIPSDHFADPAHADRAHAALLGAVELAADLRALTGGAGAPPVVSVTLPESYAGLPEAMAHADALSMLVEDFGHATDEIGAPAPENAENEAANGGPQPGVPRPGVDTGRLLLRDRPPGKTFARCSKRAATLRLNDADDTGRRPIGAGRLEVHTLIALHATLTPELPIVTDLRGLDNPDRGARAALDHLRDAGLPPLA